MAHNGGRTAFIIGGTGQIGVAATRLLTDRGWSVMVSHRGAHPGPAEFAERDVTMVRLDRDDSETLLPLARGHDLVLDAVAFQPKHAAQLAELAGDVGSLVVISTGSVYLGPNGRYLDVATGPEDFPDFPVPITEDQPTVDNDEKTYSPLKAALERRLLATDGLPVSILRPGAIHGPFSNMLREWYFIKRAIDHRPRVVLAYDGESRFSTTSTANLAELIRLCAEQPGARVLNAADEENLSVTEIGRDIFAAMGQLAEIATFPGPPRGALGGSPWSVPRPIVLGMQRARDEIGYKQPVRYADAVRDEIEWMLDVLAGAARRQQSWRDVFPALTTRYGADAWFPYEAEDEFARDRP
jgi:Nucleoside-diphosphate-sugar epimerases